MSEFLVETYAARETIEILLLRVGEVALAAGEVTQQGDEVRFVRAVCLPEDETCFYLYQSASADAVRRAVARASLRIERITEAVSIEAPASSGAD
jgi:hypothetical protein